MPRQISMVQLEVIPNRVCILTRLQRFGHYFVALFLSNPLRIDKSRSGEKLMAG